MPSTSSILQSPPFINKEALKEKIKETELSMTWCFSENSLLSFFYRNQNVYMKIILDNTMVNKLTGSARSKFLRKKNNQLLWRFSAGNKTTKKQKSEAKEIEDIQDIPLIPLRTTTNPKEITIQELTELIKNKKCCFYTGAGISAGIVPTMNELDVVLFYRLPNKETIVQALEKIVANPQTYLKHMKAFYKACLEGAPSAAHKTIAKIAIEKDWCVLTENIDLLHEHSGIKPTHRGHLFTDIDADDLKQLDIILAIGLSEDQSNFLNWYKQHNPQGIIVGINMNDVCYLSDQDYIVKRDIQETLVELAKLTS